MNPFFKAMQPKKKRPVDPNAPPRPNLLNHEKRLKDATGTVEQLQAQNIELKRRLDIMENKMANQTAYLSELHNFINRIASKLKV
jgi:predicted RNase H-like nuclease (RuvC/YqgF family)